MFKSLREFTLDKPVNRAKFKIRHTREGHEGVAYTIVKLYNTEVVKRQNINNIVTLNSGGWHTQSTKICINTALRQIYGKEAPYLYQSKGVWYLQLNTGETRRFLDGIVIGGGSGAKFQFLN
jgi:hypothetical protein